MSLKLIDQASFSSAAEYTFMMIWKVMFNFDLLDTFEFCPRTWLYKVCRPQACRLCLQPASASVPCCEVWTCWPISPGCAFHPPKARSCPHLGPRHVSMSHLLCNQCWGGIWGRGPQRPWRWAWGILGREFCADQSMSEREAHNSWLIAPTWLYRLLYPQGVVWKGRPHSGLSKSKCKGSSSWCKGSSDEP